MEYLKTVDGNLLDAKEDYLAHQCNCITVRGNNLSKQMFNKYEYANTYKLRTRGDKKTYDTPGTIAIKGNGIDKRYVINMYGQYYPSVSKYANDTTDKRIQWFKECLDEISKIDDIHNKTMAMPSRIGCGAAAGDWKQYYKIIQDFANKEKIHITLYKLE